MNVKISFITDIHIGNPKINLPRIVDSLHKYAYPELVKSQIILLGGDFFDCMLNINSDAGVIAIYIIDELIQMSLENKIYLRVLRGTFSHDRYQNRLFVDRARDIPEMDGSPLVRTVDKLEIERFKKFNIDILFCPDDQPQKDMTQAILDTINANHIDKVDYMCCHGYWEHLLPPNTPVKPHNCLDYQRLKNRVKYQIFNGHVHSPGVWNKVVSGGSFERFRHAEEEDKGFYVADLDTEAERSKLTFIRNKRAVPFITLDLGVHTTSENAMAYLERRVDQTLCYYEDKNVPIHIRIVGDGSSLVPLIKDRYPSAILTEKRNSVQKQVDVEFDSSISDLPTITVENLPRLIHDNVKDKHPEMTQIRIKEILDDTGV